MGVVYLVVLVRLLRATTEKKVVDFLGRKCTPGQNPGYACVRKFSCNRDTVPDFSGRAYDTPLIPLVGNVARQFAAIRGVAGNLLAGQTRGLGTEDPSGVQGQNMETSDNTNGAVTEMDLR